MKKFFELVKEMSEINTDKYTELINVDVEVPTVFQVIYDKLYQYFYDVMKYILSANTEDTSSLENWLTFQYAEGKGIYIGEDDNKYRKVNTELLNDKQKMYEYIESLLHKKILIAGGSISDLVINKLSRGKVFNQKDIDVFIDIDLALVIKNDLVNIKSDESRFKNDNTFSMLILKAFDDEVYFCDETRTLGFYDTDVLKEVQKVEAFNQSIDIVFDESHRFYGHLITSFDLYFRAFAFNGENVIGTRKAIEDIQNKRIDLQSVASPFSTFVRSYVFEERYGYRMDEKDRETLILSMLKRSSLAPTYFYIEWKEDLLPSLEELDNNSHRSFSEMCRMSVIKELSETPPYNKAIDSRNDFLTVFLMGHIKNIKKYDQKYDQAMRLCIKDFLSKLLSGDPKIKSKYSALSTILSQFSMFREISEKMDFFFENEMYRYLDDIHHIKNFQFDFDHFIKSGKFMETNKNLETLESDFEHIGDIISLKRMFSDNKYMLTSVRDEFLSYFEGDVFKTYEVPHMLFCALTMKNVHLTREGILSYLEEFNQNFQIVFPICSRELYYQIALKPCMFIDGTVEFNYVFGDQCELSASPEETLGGNRFLESIFNMDDVIDSNGFDNTVRYPTQIFNISLAYSDADDKYRINPLPKLGMFCYLNGTRYEKLTNHFSERLGDIFNDHRGKPLSDIA